MEQEKSNKGHFVLNAVITIAVTIALVTLLFRYIDWLQFLSMARQMSWPLCAIGFCIYAAIYLMRAGRFVLFSKNTSFTTMLYIVCVHNFMLRIMPLRTGELVYPFLAKRAGAASFGESMLALVFLRILDSTSVLVIFAVTLSFNHGKYFGDPRIGIVVSCAVAICGILVILFFNRFLLLCVRFLNLVMQCFKIKLAAQNKLAYLEEVVCAFSNMSKQTTIKATLYTVVSWVFNFVMLFVLLEAVGIHLGWAQVVLSGTAGTVSGFLPLSAIGNFGTLEAGLALGLALVGLEPGRAVAFGIAFSVITLAYAMLLALLGWPLLVFVGRKKHRLSNCKQSRF